MTFPHLFFFVRRDKSRLGLPGEWERFTKWSVVLKAQKIYKHGRKKEMGQARIGILHLHWKFVASG